MQLRHSRKAVPKSQERVARAATRSQGPPLRRPIRMPFVERLMVAGPRRPPPWTPAVALANAAARVAAAVGARGMPRTDPRRRVAIRPFAAGHLARLALPLNRESVSLSSFVSQLRAASFGGLRILHLAESNVAS